MNATPSKPVPAITVARLQKLFPGAPADMIQELADNPTWYLRANITSVGRMAMFLAQFGHETQGLRKLTESLSYSADRMAVVWPGRFAVEPTAKVKRPNEQAKLLARRPQALANNVYGGRMGNVQPGDGWLFRGRGPGLTGRDAYREVGAIVGVDFEGNPDLAATPYGAFIAGIGIWIWKGLNASADQEDVAANTKLLNGGQIGLAERKAEYAKAKAVLLGA